jgi:hypothetical protein
MGSEHWEFSDAVDFLFGAVHCGNHEHLGIQEMEEHEAHK